MIFDLTRFPGEDEKGLAAIETLEELDHYIYLVAGCVGPFWTVLHVTYRKRLGDWALREMSEEGVQLRQGAAAHQRPARRAGRSRARPVLPAGA